MPEIALVNHKPLSPPDGGTLRIEGILTGLRKNGHDVLFACWEDAVHNHTPAGGITMPRPALRPLKALANYLYGGEEGGAALELMLCNYPSLLAKLRKELRSCQILQSEQIWSALFPLMYRKAFNKVSVLDNHNVETLLAMRMADYVSNPKVYRSWIRYVSIVEKLCCRMADVVVVTSEKDKGDLGKLHGISQKKVRVIPNGTDVEKYRPNPGMASATRKTLGIGEATPVLTYVGRFGYPPNELAIRYIKHTLAPAVWKTHPDSRFLIVSRDLPEGFIDEHDGGRLTQIKDDSDYPYINAADICLAPLRVGGGTRIKIASYMACAKAVVSTPVGCEGIPATNNREIVISEFEDFPAHVLGLIENSQTRTELGRNARQFAEKTCSWENSVSAFERLHESLRSTNGN